MARYHRAHLGAAGCVDRASSPRLIRASRAAIPAVSGMGAYRQGDASSRRLAVSAGKASLAVIQAAGPSRYRRVIDSARLCNDGLADPPAALRRSPTAKFLRQGNRFEGGKLCC